MAAPPNQPDDKPRHEREITSAADPTTSLAPEEQGSIGRGGSDPAEWLSLINPEGGVEPSRPAETSAPVAAPAPAELTELVERWVRRVAFGGDQRRGVARIDMGSGEFSGGQLLVIADGPQVSVELSLPSQAPDPGLAERLRARLERRGYAAEVSVR